MKESGIKYVEIPCIQVIAEDIWSRYNMQMKSTDYINVYCDADMADVLVDYLLDEIEGSTLLDDSDLDLLDSGSNLVLVTLYGDGDIYIDSAYDEDEIADPSGVCYVCEDVPFKDLKYICEGADETIVFGLTKDCGECPYNVDVSPVNEKYTEYKDSAGKVHGFFIEGTTPGGMTYSRHVYSSDPLDPEQIEILQEIL